MKATQLCKNQKFFLKNQVNLILLFFFLLGRWVMESFKLKVKILMKKCHISINLTLSNLKSDLLVQTLLCIKSKFLSYIPHKIIRKLQFSSDFRGKKSQLALSNSFSITRKINGDPLLPTNFRNSDISVSMQCKNFAVSTSYSISFKRDCLHISLLISSKFKRIM